MTTERLIEIETETDLPAAKELIEEVKRLHGVLRRLTTDIFVSYDEAFDEIRNIDPDKLLTEAR